MESWADCKNILCIRPDNMGDLIMSGPAIRALKHTFNCKITVLTSSMAAAIVKHMPEIDNTIVFDLPWIKTDKADDDLSGIVSELRLRYFDGAVIFTVYSQSALPSAMLAYQAGIPKVLGYCRENPYGLLTHWVPDKEPFVLIKHQVQRDLDLVSTIGVESAGDKLCLTVDDDLWKHNVLQKLTQKGIRPHSPWLILHAGVSEKKREYPVQNWIAVAKQFIDRGYQVLFTGSATDRNLTDELQSKTGAGSYSLSGVFALDEFICLIKNAPLIVSVNTGPVHIAAAVGTRVVVLYAQTNPQHTPWKVPCKVLQYSVEGHMRSKNEIIRWVNNELYSSHAPIPSADEVVKAAEDLAQGQLKNIEV
ncbi:glycosyltransferase family 9 protein [Mucilaginibacter sp. HD30]